MINYTINSFILNLFNIVLMLLNHLINVIDVNLDKLNKNTSSTIIVPVNQIKFFNRKNTFYSSILKTSFLLKRNFFVKYYFTDNRGFRNKTKHFNQVYFTMRKIQYSLVTLSSIIEKIKKLITINWFNEEKINKNSEIFINNFNIKTSFFTSFIQILAWTITTVFWIKARASYYTNNWIYTTNHKRIAVNYFWFVILSGIVGMVLATIIRLEFAYPGVGILAGDSIQYLSLASAHGVIMVFFMIMPLLFGAFANFLLPTQLGVHDVAFPRLNSAAFWFLPGGLLMLCQLVCVDRRYQRMNCFNIREVESLLKRRFFTDLITSKDHHTLLDKTSLGLRYKLNDNTFLNNNINSSYNYGLNLNVQTRNSNFLDFFFTKTTDKFDDTQSFSPNFYFFKIISYFETTNFFNNVISTVNSIFFFLLEKNFLFVDSSRFWNEFFTIINLLGNFFISFKNIIWNVLTVFYRTVSFFFTLFILSPINGLYLFLSILFYFFSFLFNITKPTLIDLFQKILHSLKFFYFETIKFFKKIFNFKELYNTFNDIYKFQSEFEFFSNNNPFYSYSIFFFTKIRNILLPFSKQISKEFTFDYSIYRFKINYNFKDNSFIVNIYNMIKIMLNNLFACFSVKNMKYRWRCILAKKDEAHKVKYEPHISPEAEPISYRNLLDRSLTKTYENSLMLEFYSLLFLILNAPIIFINFILYLFSHHMWFLEVHQMKPDFIVWSFNTWKGIDSDTSRETARAVLDLLTFENLSNLRKKAYTRYEPMWQNFTDSILSLYFFFSELVSLLFFMLSYFWVLGFKPFSESTTFAFDIFLVKCAQAYTDSYFRSNINSLSTDLLSFYNLLKSFKVNKITFKLNFLNKYKTTDFVANESEKTFLLNNEELSANSRFLRFDNPVFKYDYKSGDYFPKLYKDLYSFLIPSILDLTSGLRTAPWFFSPLLSEILESNLTTIIDNFSKKIKFSNNSLYPTKLNKINHTDVFYNFFFTLNKEHDDLNLKWISTNSLNTKFNRMFLTSSLQQRIYGNWRNLKFTREAWRCKMLLARHQKTLFRRYMHEDGVFWSIERNAKDLIPGWAMITPFSSRTRYTAVGKTDIGLMGVLLVLNSSIISGANFLVTYRYLSTLNNRKMRDARAFFTEAVMVASWMMILANPMLVIGIIMLISDRHWQTSFFDYSGGGDTVLFQHMFWFFGHPEVYIIIIPTFGFTNTMVSYYLKKRVSARASLLYSLYTIAFLGFFVWGHHMYMVGLSHTTRMLFSTLTVMISVPAATKIMHWCVTTANSAFAMELPLLCTFTFIFFFVSGGISGMCVAHTGMDVLFHDTFYVIGHFHVMLASGAMFASFGAFYFYFPAIFGVKYSRIYAYLHYAYYLVGQLMTVIPMFWLGYAGMPRRVLDYPAAFGGWHSVISAGHMLNVAGLMAFFIMIFDSLRQAKAATRNTFGISRYNTRLNFYIYEIARLTYIQQKTLFLFKFFRKYDLKLNGKNYINFEPYETVLFSYIFLKK